MAGRLPSQRGARRPIDQILQPFQEFTQVEASGGIVLLACAVVALLWANSPWSGSYHGLWQTQVTVGVGSFEISKALLLWINDGLMAVFFFVVGLEIKREMLVGELASLRQAALPIAAAVGGMVAPALIYFTLNAGQEGASGWGIPMATDIAFALGILALLGKAVPVSLKVFLAALAIVDDLGAVLVIALFYTADIAWMSLLAGAGFLLLLIVANYLHVRHPLVYAILGVGLWVAFLKSGVHATIAGVVLAMTIPARQLIRADEFLAGSRAFLDEIEKAAVSGKGILENERKLAAVQALDMSCRAIETPLGRLEHALHPWVAFFIMPIFALANAGVTLGGGLGAALSSPVALGVIAGLVVGKQFGVTLFSWLVVRSGLAALPEGVGWRHVYGAAWLAGIGFTMSLFIAGLAFGEGAMLGTSKVGILTASLIAGGVGFILLKRASAR